MAGNESSGNRPTDNRIPSFLERYCPTLARQCDDAADDGAIEAMVENYDFVGIYRFGLRDGKRLAEHTPKPEIIREVVQFTVHKMLRWTIICSAAFFVVGFLLGRLL